MKNSEYIIDWHEAEAIKGILILLIVFGHVHAFNLSTDAGDLREYLYSFHVLCFFILPFFYKTHRHCSWKKFGDIVTRNWIPYLWVLPFCLASVFIVKQQIHFGWDSVLAMINGTQTPLAEKFGFVFPWFLPAYCSFSVMLMVARKYKVIYWLFAAMSIVTFFLSYNQFFALKMALPFALGLSICYFGFGVITSWIARLGNTGLGLGALTFIGLSVCWWMHVDIPLFLYKLLPVTFFLLLLCFLPYFNCKLIRSLGKNSLCIYLANVFIVNVAYMVLPHNAYFGVLTLIVSVLIPWALSLCISKVKFIKSLVFPRSLREFIGI